MEVISEEFKATSGTKQGCPLSPLLFDIGMEPLGIQLRKNLKGITTNGVNSKSLQYADDTSMYVKDYKDLEVWTVGEVSRK